MRINGDDLLLGTLIMFVLFFVILFISKLE